MKKISIGTMALLGFLGAKMTLAAPDPDLQASLASTTAFANDNKGEILQYIVGLIFVVFIIVIAKKGILWGFGQLSGIFGGRRRRR